MLMNHNKVMQPEVPLGFRNSPTCCSETSFADEGTRGHLGAGELWEKQPLIMRFVGIVLICIGLLTLALPYVTFTKKEKVIDIGPLEAVAEKKERIPISPIVGAVVLIAGAGIVIASVRKGSL